METDDETSEYEWVHAPEIRRRETVPDLWESYERVRPRVATVRDDATHGAATLSVRALEVLRDEAALAADGVAPTDGDRRANRETDRTGNGWEELAALAEDLVAVRPSMAVVANRVNRAMAAAAAEGRTPTAVERAAREGIERALAVDAETARIAAEELPARVATLSRSGTVRATFREASPETILVAESRPGGEGRAVAESLADDLPNADVTLTTDAAFAFLLDERGVEALVVGADRILPDGRVVNKAGTRAAALAAPADCETVVVASTDKVAAEAGPRDVDNGLDLEEREAAKLYDGDAPVTVANPTFDVTPAGAIDAVVTERGRLAPDEVRTIADEHRARTEW